MFGSTIKSRVMKHVNDKINKAQKAHDEEVKDLEHKAWLDKSVIDIRLKGDIENSADNFVKSIIGNIL